MATQRSESSREEAITCGERGGGGKLPRRSTRKVFSTPYDRPPSQTPRRNDGWISKVADPASRLANRLLSSLFGKSGDSSTADAELEPADVQISPPAVSPLDRTEINRTRGTNETVEHVGSHDEVRPSGSHNDGGISDIEQFMMQKTFTKDEYDRLTGLLQSRTIDFPCNGERARNTSGLKGTAVSSPQSQRQRAKLKESIIDNPLEPEYRVPGRTTPIPTDIGLSPIDIAKAFMGTRTVDRTTWSSSSQLKGGRVRAYDTRSNPFLSSSAAELSAAKTHTFPDYFTPQSQRSAASPFLSQTPYSRPMSKMASSGRKSLNISSVRHRHQTPIFQAATPSSYYIGERNSTVGVIGTASQSLADRSKEIMPYYTRASGYPPFANGSCSPSTLPAGPNSIDNVESTGTNVLHHVEHAAKAACDSFSVHPRSSEMAHKILEHLNRTIPSPRDKLEELRLVRSRNKEAFGTNIGVADAHKKDDRSTLENMPKISNHNASENAGFGKSSSKRFGHISINEVLKQSGDQSLLQRREREGTSVDSEVVHPATLSNAKSDVHPGVCADSDAFTFPVRASNDACGELPTPRVAHFITSKASEVKGASSVPSYSFRSSGTIVGTSSKIMVGSLNYDSSAPVFRFGSLDNKSRLSFRFAGKSTSF